MFLEGPWYSLKGLGVLVTCILLLCLCVDMHGGGRSMMMPQGDPGMHGGMMGRGGYGPPHGPHHPHMDYYYHHPYGMDSYYGGGGERPPYGG